MAKFEEVFLSGKLSWVKTKNLNKFGKWSATIYPDSKSLLKVQELIEQGIKNTLKKDDDGYYISFIRPPDKTDKQGRKFSLNPPTVIDKDGRLLEEYVGNGSDGILKLEVYGGPSPMGGTYKAARLAGIKIHNLVPYKPEEQAEEKFELRTVSGFKDQPVPKDTW